MNGDNAQRKITLRPGIKLPLLQVRQQLLLKTTGVRPGTTIRHSPVHHKINGMLDSLRLMIPGIINQHKPTTGTRSLVPGGMTMPPRTLIGIVEAATAGVNPDIRVSLQRLPNKDSK